MSMFKKVIIGFVAIGLLGVVGVVALVASVNNSLPKLITLEDYKPLLKTDVYSRDGKKIGEFFRERRVLVPYEKIPKHVVQAFLAAEDDQFFEHKGINLVAITRAMIANMKAGRTVQGGSTITQQVAKTLLLSSEKTFTRKIKDALLALKMEENLKKEEILFLYLNQIYFGQGSYGIGVAAETYFRKPVEKLTIPEAAILAGLPQAPSRYSPVRNPKRAKERQLYVIRRMKDVGYIDANTAEVSAKEPVKVFVKEKYEDMAPFFLETVRLVLVKMLGEEAVLDSGLKIYTSLDLPKQLAAQESVMNGLRELDKRQGYRGPLKNIGEDKTAIKELLDAQEKDLLQGVSLARAIAPDGTMTVVPEDEKKIPVKVVGTILPEHIRLNKIYQGVVSSIDDKWGLVTVQLPQFTGLIDFESMQWARKPDPMVKHESALIKKPSEALKIGDVILTRITSEKFASDRFNKLVNAERKKNPGKKDAELKIPSTEKYLTVILEQEPTVEAALISLDLKTEDILAMVGGTDFEKSEFNRTYQAARQTGSSFKSIVYAAALDHGYTPATPILDAPIVYEETKAAEDNEGQEEKKTWKPSNHGNSFSGDILFRNALVKSLNIPTVKIIEDIGVPWSAAYAQRLGIFSPLNMDFTLALGSSSVTLYEMTKVFANLGRLGHRINPLLVHKVVDRSGKTVTEKISLDVRFEQEIKPLEEEFEKKRQEFLASQKVETVEEQAPPAEGEAAVVPKKPKQPELYFEDQNQLIKPTTAYLITSLLKATVEDVGGTGGRARGLGREVAGKTGTTNGYYDAWFIGFTPQISTGVWVGYDQEKTLGVGEVGGRSALPIWVDYMKVAHEGLPLVTFPIPPGIVFSSIDNETGKLPTSKSRQIVRQAFLDGTQPTATSSKKEEETDFYKQDLSE